MDLDMKLHKHLRSCFAVVNSYIVYHPFHIVKLWICCDSVHVQMDVFNRVVESLLCVYLLLSYLALISS